MLIVHPARRVLATSVTWATGWRDRTRGVRGSSGLRSGEALILVPARQVHTFGVARPIDVVFCDADWRVLHLVRRMARRRVTRWVRGARYVVELPGGTLAEDIATGARIEITARSDRR